MRCPPVTDYNTASLLGNTGQGEWYSLEAETEGKYWRNATIVKTINAACQARSLDKLVQQTGQACFDACPQPTNQSSSCWIECASDRGLEEAHPYTHTRS